MKNMSDDGYIHIKKETLEKYLHNRVEEIVQQRVDAATQTQQREFDRRRQQILSERIQDIKQKFMSSDSKPDSFLKPSSKFEPKDDDSWLTTYSDVVTLILTLFVLLFALSRFDLSKFDEVKKAINKDLLKKESESEYEKLKKNMSDIMKKYRIDDAATVKETENGLMIEFPSYLVFDQGSALIKPGMDPILSTVASSIKSSPDQDYLIDVEGHTDNVPINTQQYPSNWELSTARATTIVRSFLNEGISPNKLRASGFADTRPKTSNYNTDGTQNPQAQAQNRRVTIYISFKPSPSP